MGKQLVIVGADFSAVAIGTAKVLVSISATISGTQYTNSAPTLAVTATWDDQSTSTVSGWTTSPAVWTSTVGQQTMTVSYTRGSVTRTTTVTADVQQGGGPTPTTYTVSASATYGSVSPTSTTVTSGGNATFTVSPVTGYTVSASDISITSGSGNCGTPTVSGTTVTVPNVTGAVTIAIACHEIPSGSYTITPTLSHCTLSNTDPMAAGTTKSITLTSETSADVAVMDYDIPSTITINGVTGTSGSTGVTWSYNTSTGVITLSNPSANITITASGVEFNPTASYELGAFKTPSGGTHPPFIENDDSGAQTRSRLVYPLRTNSGATITVTGGNGACVVGYSTLAKFKADSADILVGTWGYNASVTVPTLITPGTNGSTETDQPTACKYFRPFFNQTSLNPTNVTITH